MANNLLTALAALPPVGPGSRMMLTESNYSVWTTWMEAELDNLGFLGVVDGTLVLPSDPPAEDLVNFAIAEKKSYNYIIRHLDDTNLAYASEFALVYEKTGGGLWTHLRNKYAPNNVFFQTFVFQKFLNLRYTGCADFCRWTRASLAELRRAGLILPEQVLIIMVLAKLPKSLESFVRVVSHGMTDGTEASSILVRLEQDFHQQASFADSSSTALISSGNKNPGHICSACKKPGHLEPRCWISHPELKPAPRFRKPAANLVALGSQVAQDDVSSLSSPVGPTVLFAGMDLNDPLVF